MGKGTQSKVKAAIVLGVVLLVAIGGMTLLWEPSTGPAYTRDATRQTIDVEQSDFIQSLKAGAPVMEKIMGERWLPTDLPVKKEYEEYLKEKIAFTRQGETISNYTQIFIFDTYDLKAFPTISDYAKKHAKELQQQDPNGRIKVLHDGDRAFIYQWAVKDDAGKTEYIELGKIELTKEGLLAIRYINKGTGDLEQQRRRALNLFGTI